MKSTLAKPVRSLLNALLGLACSAAAASDWRAAAQSKDGMEHVFVDVASIHIEGVTRRAWEKWVPAHHTMRGTGENAKKFISYELSRVAFNCSDETSKTEATVIYFSDGTTEPLLPEVLSKTWEPVPPDSVLSFELQFVCEWQAK